MKRERKKGGNEGRREGEKRKRKGKGGRERGRQKRREEKQRDILVVSNIVFKNKHLVWKSVVIFFKVSFENVTRYMDRINYS